MLYSVRSNGGTTQQYQVNHGMETMASINIWINQGELLNQEGSDLLVWFCLWYPGALYSVAVNTRKSNWRVLHSPSLSPQPFQWWVDQSLQALHRPGIVLWLNNTCCLWLVGSWWYRMDFPCMLWPVPVPRLSVPFFPAEEPLWDIHQPAVHEDKSWDRWLGENWNQFLQGGSWRHCFAQDTFKSFLEPRAHVHQL